MDDPFCAIKLGRCSMLCLCDASAAWTGYEQEYEPIPSRDAEEEELPHAERVFEPASPSTLGSSPRSVPKPANRRSFFRRQNAHLEVSSFMTTFIQLAWPKLSGAVKKIMDDQILEALHAVSKKLPESMQGTVHHTVQFGHSAPSIEEVYSYREDPSSSDGIEVCGHMRWDTEVDMKLKVGPLQVGIDQIQLDGIGCIVFRPLLAQSPVLGGFHLFYCEMPKLHVGLTGFGGITQWSTVDARITKLVEDAFRTLMVLPQRITQRFATTQVDDMPTFRNPAPVGVLQVQVLAARNLVGVDINLAAPISGSRTSDPYCVLRLGDSTMQTGTRNCTLHPDWSDDKAMSFLVYHTRQKLHLEVYDANTVANDVLLARFDSDYAVAELQQRQSEWLPLEVCARSKNDGSLECAVQVTSAYSEVAPVEDVSAGSVKILSVKLYRLEGVPLEHAQGAQVRLRTGKRDVLSKPCKIVDPGSICGFGKKVQQQIDGLLRHGISPEILAETFGVSADAVGEVARAQRKEQSWFSWDQALHLLLQPDETSALQLEVRLAGPKQTFRPLRVSDNSGLELSMLLWRCRRLDSGEPCQLAFEWPGGSGSVGISLELLAPA
eukprot:TRINITY_DN30975_c0_g1_i2.p1 TRINITY_DN30975_c0_g1~~TRINITY_DN30975_c0_g1_i2.p1  ORF type:complete len:660 (-),score=103.90 TRINITY_DN30975_c0_g1_i2:67-1884(-)